MEIGQIGYMSTIPRRTRKPLKMHETDGSKYCQDRDDDEGLDEGETGELISVIFYIKKTC